MGNDTTLAQPQTKYSALDDNSLMDMYRESVWYDLCESDRRELLQETVNREVVNNGGKYTCTVSFEDLGSDFSGKQIGDTIEMNREMFVKDQISKKYDETTIVYNLKDSNYQGFETLMHEHQHVLQEKIADGTIDAPPEIKAKFESNNFTVTEIDGQRASQYMLGETSYDLYYLNPTELDAHSTSQEKAMALVNEHKAKYGEDNSISSYEKNMSKTGFESTLAGLKEKYGENIDKQVEQVLLNKYNNTHVPVDKKIEKAVENEMIATQRAIDLENRMEENNDMKLDSEELYGDNSEKSVIAAFDAAQSAEANSTTLSLGESAAVSAEGGMSAGAVAGVDGGCSASCGTGM